jgi:hypothetical protein
MYSKGKVAAGGAVAGGTIALAANQAAKFVGRNDASSGGGTSELDVVKVGPGRDPGFVDQIFDFFMMDVLGGGPLIAFILAGSIIAVLVFSDNG